MSAVSFPPLERVLAAARARRRIGWTVVGLFGGFAVSGFAAAALVAVRMVASAVGEPPWSFFEAIGGALLAGAAVFAVSLVAAARRLDEERLARDVDVRLALPDTVASALALARGRVESPLAPYVLAQAGPALDGAAPRIETAVFVEGAAGPLARQAAVLAVFAWILALVLGIVDALRFGPWPLGLLGRSDGPGGITAKEDPSAQGPVPAPRGTGADGETPKPAGVPSPEGKQPQAPIAPPKPDDTPPDAAEPDVHVKVRPAREEFPAGVPILVVASATPTREFSEDRKLELSLDVDGVVAPTRVVLSVGPSAPGGVGEIQDLRRLPELAAKLKAGEHTVRARFRDPQDGVTFDSEPAKFRIKGDDNGDSGGGGKGGGSGGGQGEQQPQPPQPEPPQPQPQPQPEPPPQPETAPPPPGPIPAPESPTGEGPPPPDIHPKFDPQVVVPLFGEGDEIQKKGPTVVLVPGGGPAGDIPEPQPLAEALPDAVKRAEKSVDRAGVRAADRDLVRRYFEELLRRMR